MVDNVLECEKYGIPYGAYLYSYADTVAKAKSEAAHVLRLVRGHKITYPIYYDLEDNYILSHTNAKQRQKIIQTLRVLLRKQGILLVYLRRKAGLKRTSGSFF